MPIYVVGPGEAYATIAAALADIAALSQPLTEFQQVEVRQAVALESIVIPPAIDPTALGQLHIVNHELDRPLIDDVTLDKEHVKLSGFDIQGDVVGGKDGQLFSENICRGQVLFEGDGITPMAIRIYNNSVFPKDKDGLVIRNVIGTVRALFNSCLGRTDGPDPFYAFVIENSDVEARFNIFAALGESSFARAIRLKNTVGSFLTVDRNLYAVFQAATMGTYEDGGGAVDVVGFTAWQAASGLDGTSINQDPEFKCMVEDEDHEIELDVSNTSPAIAEGDYDLDVQVDIDKTRRPTLVGGPNQSTTLGAYEEAQIITHDGIVRILELIGGLNLNSVTHVGVGEKGTITALEYLRPETPSAAHTALMELIFMRTIVERFVVDITAKFKCVLGPTPAMTDALLDGRIHEMREVGLFTTDGVLFMRRTLYRLPFDPLSVLEATFTFGVSVGPCEEVTSEGGPELFVTAEAV
jgi:acyl-CoA-binding protein